MWQTRAVLSHLLEAAGLGPAEADGPLEPEEVLQLLRSARRRARLVVAVDWVAILCLLLLGDGAAAGLAIGPGQEAVFSLGILAVAVHSGYRLAQLEKYGAVERGCRELLRIEGGG